MPVSSDPRPHPYVELDDRDGEIRPRLDHRLPAANEGPLGIENINEARQSFAIKGVELPISFFTSLDGKVQILEPGP